MSFEDILLALRAREVGTISRTELSKLLTMLDSGDSEAPGLPIGELLTRVFQVSPERVRELEREISGRSRRKIGRYQLRRKVGQGGMGLVFEAHDPNLGRNVALKLLAGDRVESPTSVQRFLREVKSAGSFNHPNIVHSYDAGIDGDLPYLVMEFVDGENLYQVLKRKGKIDPDEGLSWLSQAARALDVLERQRWVHGDVKPSNFILTRNGEIKLADLGLCGPPGKPRQGASPHGTPPYVAPEVLAGEVIDHRSDIFSLGATWYHLLSGRPHRHCRTMKDLIEQGDVPFPPLSELRPDLSTGVVKVVMRLLQTDPRRRFQTGSSLIQALDPLLPELKSDPDEETQVEFDEPIQTGTPVSRRGLIALTILVIVLGVLLGILFGPGAPSVGKESRSAVEGEVEETLESAEPRRSPDNSPWQVVREEAPGDYRAQFAWLVGPGSQYAESDLWRQELIAELAQIVGPQWQRVRNQSQLLRQDRRFLAALELLDTFPSEWRAGTYQLAWQQAVDSTIRAQNGVLARTLLEFESVIDPWNQWQLWTSLNASTPADLVWLRKRVQFELGELGFLSVIETQFAESATEAVSRQQSLGEQLLAGINPEPRRLPSSAESWPQELALAWLAKHPQVGGAAGPLLPRIYEAGLLAEIDPSILSQLLALTGEVADLPAEIEAAKLAASATEACRQYERQAAEKNWDLLERPHLRGTMVSKRVLPDRLVWTQELNHGAFLRSDAFIATVSGRWGEIPTLLWDPAAERFEEEWRLYPDHWRVVGQWRRAHGLGSPRPLELALPFGSKFSLSLELRVPEREWVALIGRGESAFGILGEGGNGAVRVSGGTSQVVTNNLNRGRGAPWLVSFDRDQPRVFRLEIDYDSGLWKLSRGAGLSFPTDHPDDPSWIWLRLSQDVSVSTISISGQPVEVWLDARQKALEAALGDSGR